MAIRKILVANRSEIAIRIFRAANELGMRTVAVYAEQDKLALHRFKADEAYQIGRGPHLPEPLGPIEAYLSIPEILRVAKAAGADAIHPGYGFLSESPEFAEACAEAGIVFIGPSPETMRRLGNKVAARNLAIEAGVPVMPATDPLPDDMGEVRRLAAGIGYPVMLKASWGGGGRGMRVIRDEEALLRDVAAAKREAKAAFGKDEIYLEKLVERARHVEVQILGDAHGNLVHLFERDCSIQRRHQKVVERAPAPYLDADQRAELSEYGLRIGRAAHYRGAGTVEFLMDADTGRFYFIEVNPRVQVEHTVTEEITGLDLVELQLRAAAGEKLALTQDEVTCNGHAIQARLTAEDASAGFRPDTGKVLLWSPPAELRCDAGIEPGAEIGAAYDSMIAKLIAHGPDRDAARRKLLSGLDRLEVAGLATTRLFLRDALASPDFAQGNVTTDFIARNWPDGWRVPEADGLALAAAALASRPRAAATPWQALSGFRLLAQAGCPARVTYVDAAAPERRVVLEAREAGGWQTIGKDGETQEIAAQWTGPDRVRITRDGVAESFAAAHHDGRMWLCGPGTEIACAVLPLGDLGQDRAAGDGASPERIAAPMPGLVVEIRVAAGDTVAKGDTLVVMESMKLLMELKAAADGTVAEIAASERDTVEAGRLLVRLEPAER